MSNDLPITIIIFGGTGDLVRKKIIPAIYDLYLNKFLPEKFNILGVSRKNISDDDFKIFIKDSLKNKDVNDDFLNKVQYFSADVSDKESFDRLKIFLNEEDEKRKVCTNKVFYLAVSPKIYENAFINLKESGLMNLCVGANNQSSWSRILVEKPFGNDMEHAEKLDKMLGEFFDESQIFRIDHYLAKETLQNILTFRFGNAIFEPIWNSDSIEKIEINMFENLEVLGRGELYDGVGALRDVGQNHVLQMLALIAMEDPEKLDISAIRDKRAALLQEVSLANDAFDFAGLGAQATAPRAQYIGYTEIPGVSQDSQTETFFNIKAHINNPRWKGTDFYLSAGKVLKDSYTEIIVTFKEKPTSICPKEDLKEYKNIINFRIQPNESINIQFWSKKPGFNFEVYPQNLSFSYKSDTEKIPDAYERVLFDCIKGDQMLFVSTREVLAQWKFIDNVIKEWQKIPLIKYEKGIDPKEIKVTM